MPAATCGAPPAGGRYLRPTYLPDTGPPFSENNTRRYGYRSTRGLLVLDTNRAVIKAKAGKCIAVRWSQSMSHY